MVITNNFVSQKTFINFKNLSLRLINKNSKKSQKTFKKNHYFEPKNSQILPLNLKLRQSQQLHHSKHLKTTKAHFGPLMKLNSRWV